MARQAFPELQRTDIDGVAAFWVDGIPGPRRSALTSRVGRADEPVARSGITHLVEHLVLAPLGVQDYDHNGVVEDIRTMFFVSGDDDDLVAFYGGVTRGLADLPVDRIAVERRILADEARQRGGNVPAAIRWFRFGASGHGQVGIDELGIGWLGPEPVRDWAQTRFTREATALLISGPPPAGLRLPLPDGPAHAVPPAEPIADVRFPTHVSWDGPGVTVSMVVPRIPAAPVLAQLIQRRARQRLRFDSALMYDVTVDYSPLERDLAHLTIGGDCQPQRIAAVRDELLDVLDAIARSGPTEEELEAAHRAFTGSLADDDTLLQYLDATIGEYLLGGPIRSIEQIVAERADVDAETVATLLRGALDTMLVLAAAEAPAGERFTPYPVWSVRSVEGRQHGPAGFYLPWNRPKERLLVGGDGVTYLSASRQPLTVRFAEAVACTHPTEFERILWGRDGFRVHVAAPLWDGGMDVLAAIDQAIPPELVACDTHGVGALAVPEE